MPTEGEELLTLFVEAVHERDELRVENVRLKEGLALTSSGAKEEGMFNKFASRKFTAGVGTFIALILGTSGVIDQATEITVAESIGVTVYILGQSIVDAIAALKAPTPAPTP